ncbi:MAG TPA: hypothetical protein VHF69_10965 [Candidatus Synoicihabitans sp.]|nr:hypothetical protein [Candidatus Synoicihabitans sp.]
MKRLSSIVLLFTLATASAAVAADSRDCCAATSCCDAAGCSDASACTVADEAKVGLARVDEQRLQMVSELSRLVSKYVLSPVVRAELTKLLHEQPERAYRHPVFTLALLNQEDQAAYQRICDYFDC